MLAIPLPLPGCLSPLSTEAVSFLPNTRSSTSINAAYQGTHLTSMGLNIQHPRFVPVAVYGILGDSLVCHSVTV